MQAAALTASRILKFCCKMRKQTDVTNRCLFMGSSRMKRDLLCKIWRVKCFILSCTKYIHCHKTWGGGELILGELISRTDISSHLLVLSCCFDGHWLNVWVSCSLDQSALDLSISRKEDGNTWIIFEAKTALLCLKPDTGYSRTQVEMRWL